MNFVLKKIFKILFFLIGNLTPNLSFMVNTLERMVDLVTLFLRIQVLRNNDTFKFGFRMPFYKIRWRLNPFLLDFQSWFSNPFYFGSFNDPFSNPNLIILKPARDPGGGFFGIHTPTYRINDILFSLSILDQT